VRLFIGITVPANKAFHEILKELKQHDELKCVEPGNLHINLKFLGEVSDELAPEIRGKVDALRGSGEFDVLLRGIGAFPNTNFVRVIWAGAHSEKLVLLAKLMDAEMAELGFKREGDYKAHVTLARVRKKPGAWINGLFSANTDKDFGILRVKDVCLIKSVLTKKGPEYAGIHAVNLGD
jgi:2'-5' RNA ligase